MSRSRVWVAEVWNDARKDWEPVEQSACATRDGIRWELSDLRAENPGLQYRGVRYVREKSRPA